LEHVALRKFQYEELDRQFRRNYFLPQLAALSTSRSSLTERCALVDDILDSADRRFSRPNETLTNTKANLSSDVFAGICLVCGIPTEPFTDEVTFIDIILLKRRNEIAHGEDTFVAIDDLDDLADKTVAYALAVRSKRCHASGCSLIFCTYGPCSWSFAPILPLIISPEEGVLIVRILSAFGEVEVTVCRNTRHPCLIL
jgi:hypothetical protein